jgi:hypothetical protein
MQTTVFEMLHPHFKFKILKLPAAVLPSIM